MPDETTPEHPFSGLMQEAVERSRTEAQAQFEVMTVESLLDCPHGGAILDVPCGAGRLALALAARGYQVTGVDNQPALLASAGRLADERGVRLTLDQRDMRDLPWEDTFDGALCFWESFGYFDDADNLDFLRAVAGTLKPGGRFVFDTQIAETLFPKLHVNRDWVQVGDIRVLEERTYDPATALWRRDWTLIRGDRVETPSITIRIYTYRQLSELLSEAGFSAIKAYSFLSQMPFKLSAQRLLMVAVK
jgi:2-polyprenyl-3-methyl-5-hydroxy-6-metoxy-1,4-benzoquinol methylase